MTERKTRRPATKDKKDKKDRYAKAALSPSLCAGAIAERKRINQVLRDARDFIRRTERMIVED